MGQGGAGAVVILPTYNERENLPAIVPAILEALPEANVLVVDDLSPDGTGEVADALASGDSRIFVVHRSGPRGLGYAYLHGYRWALANGYSYVIGMDADFSHQPKYLPVLLDAIRGADLVLGSRYIPGGGVEGWGRHRELISRGGNLFARGVLGLRQRDLTGGFKCYRREVLEGVDLDSVRSAGYVFQVEMTYRALRRGFRVAEVPIVFPDRTVGESKMGAGIVREAFTAVLRLRWTVP